MRLEHTCTPCTYRLPEFYCIQFNILYDIDRVRTVKLYLEQSMIHNSEYIASFQKASAV